MTPSRHHYFSGKTPAEIRAMHGDQLQKGQRDDLWATYLSLEMKLVAWGKNPQVDEDMFDQMLYYMAHHLRILSDRLEPGDAGGS